MAARFEIWEPEESVGKIWHAFSSRIQAPVDHGAAAVRLEDVEGRLEVFFRGLGGAKATEIKPASAQNSHHRLSFRRALGTYRENPLARLMTARPCACRRKLSNFPRKKPMPRFISGLWRRWPMPPRRRQKRTRSGGTCAPCKRRWR